MRYFCRIDGSELIWGGGESLGGVGFGQEAEAAVGALEGFSERYRALLGRREARPQLLQLGQDLFAWIDREGWLSAAVEDDEDGALVVEFQARRRRRSRLAQRFLELPFELLATAEGFLAEETGLGFTPLRRIVGRDQADQGSPSAPWSRHRLGVVFMAAAPADQRELDFEAEELAILRAVEDANSGIPAQERIELRVEETGSLGTGLHELLAVEPLRQVLHMSCHGDHLADGRPYLALEDEFGATVKATVDALPNWLPLERPEGSKSPPLVFVSACLTGTPGGAGAGPPAPDAKEVPGAAPSAQAELASAFILDLVQKRRAPAALGWDGSVADGEATAFAAALYRDLADGLSLERAVASAREELLVRPPPAWEGGSQHWHLARLWLGPAGGGVLVGEEKRSTAVEPQFLGNAEVTPPALFAGRRRPLQRALRALRGQDQAGVLVLGEGGAGKSSLAWRLSQRLATSHRTIVVPAEEPMRVSDRSYGAQAIADAVLAPLGATVRDEIPAEHGHDLRLHPATLEALLDRVLATAEVAQRPLLLVIDDFERLLDLTAALEGRQLAGPLAVRREFQPVVAAVLGAFERHRATGGKSRLLLTSRYGFRLLDDGPGLASVLALLSVAAMRPREREKQTLLLRLARERGGAATADQQTLQQERIFEAAARGNPRLQALLWRVAFGAEVDAARLKAELATLEAYWAEGRIDGEGWVAALLRDLRVEERLAALSAADREALQVLSLFELPIPEAVAKMVVVEHERQADVTRLEAASLIDRQVDTINPREAGDALSLSPFVRPHLRGLDAAERHALAAATTPALFTLWQQGGEPRTLAAAQELFRLARLGGDLVVASACVAAVLFDKNFIGNFNESANIGRCLHSKFKENAMESPALFLWRLGEAEAKIGCHARAQEIFEELINYKSLDQLARCGVFISFATSLQREQRFSDAEKIFLQAKEEAKVLKNERYILMANIGIADCKAKQGQFMDFNLLVTPEAHSSLTEILYEYEYSQTFNEIYKEAIYREDGASAICVSAEYAEIINKWLNPAGSGHTRWGSGTEAEKADKN